MISLLTWWNCLKVQRANHMDNERHRWSQAAKDLFEEREEAKIMFGDIVLGQIGWFGKVARVELSLDAIWQKHINTLALMWILDIGYSGSACSSLELQYYTLPFTTKRGARLQRNYTQFTNYERRKMKKVNQSVVENIWRLSSIDFNLIRYFYGTGKNLAQCSCCDMGINFSSPSMPPTLSLDKTPVPPSTFFMPSHALNCIWYHLIYFQLSRRQFNNVRTTLTTFSSGQARLMEFHSAMELTMIINVPTPERQPGRSSEILLILLIRLRLPANSASVMKSFITDSFCWLVLSMHEVPDEDLLLVYGVYVSFAK